MKNFFKFFTKKTTSNTNSNTNSFEESIVNQYLHLGEIVVIKELDFLYAELSREYTQNGNTKNASILREKIDFVNEEWSIFRGKINQNPQQSYEEFCDRMAKTNYVWLSEDDKAKLSLS